MAQARVLLINLLPCLAASPQCHLARSDGTPGKNTGMDKWEERREIC